MGYQTAHYNKFGDPNNCVSFTMYVPDGGNLKSQISQQYFNLFGRWGEPGGVEGWVNVWNQPNNSGFSSVYAMVLSGAGGELAGISANGRHSGLGTGSCPPPPYPGCTDPYASNYNPSANINDGSCTYIILGCMDNLASNYNSSANTDNGSCTYVTPSISLSFNPTAIKRGETSRLSWSVTNSTSRTLTDQGNVLAVDDVDLSPTNTSTYTLSASYYSYTSNSASATLTVYIPPTITLSSSNGLTLIAGQCTTISWTPAGDYSTISWTKGPLTNTNTTSFEQDCPSDTTTYCAVLSGLGGVSPETCLTVIVYQIPTASITSPDQINYGENFNMSYTTKYANSSITITPTYNYTDGTTATGTVITRTAANSNQASDLDSDTVRDGIVPITVVYNTIGPASISLSISAVGDGGTAIDSDTTTVIIDRTPENLTIEESEDLLKDAVPVKTPDSIILSEFYEIDDIDIPVEVKSDWPINVDINQQSNWQKVRQI